jgi:hypothetical protein
VIKGLKPPCERNDFPSNEILNEIKEEDLRELVRKITSEGLKAFAAAAGKFTSLETIDLDNNQITDEGLKAFAAAADKFTSLQKI